MLHFCDVAERPERILAFHWIHAQESKPKCTAAKKNPVYHTSYLFGFGESDPADGEGALSHPQRWLPEPRRRAAGRPPRHFLLGLLLGAGPCSTSSSQFPPAKFRSLLSLRKHNQRPNGPSSLAPGSRVCCFPSTNSFLRGQQTHLLSLQISSSPATAGWGR